MYSSIRNAAPQFTFKVIYEQHLEESSTQISQLLYKYSLLLFFCCSGGEDLDKLKLTKNYFKNIMKQQSFTNLSLISIGHQRTRHQSHLTKYSRHLQLINQENSNLRKSLKLTFSFLDE